MVKQGSGEDKFDLDPSDIAFNQIGLFVDFIYKGTLYVDSSLVYLQKYLS